MPIPELYKLGFQDDKYGANIPFKHQQIVEMVPLFVHPEFQTQETYQSFRSDFKYFVCLLIKMRVMDSLNAGRGNSKPLDLSKRGLERVLDNCLSFA